LAGCSISDDILSKKTGELKLAICRFCGEYIEEGVDYCPSCGEAVDNSSRSNSWYTVGGDEKEGSKPVRTSKKPGKKLLIPLIAAGALVVIAAVVVIIILSKPRLKDISISLSDYVDISRVEYHMDNADGQTDNVYNGRGYFDDSESGPMSMILDRTELLQYMIRSAGGKVSQDVRDRYNAFINSIKYHASFGDGAVNGQLKNGDLIIAEAQYDQSLANELRLDVSGTRSDCTVGSLMEVEMIDPLGDVEAVFSGTAPYDINVELTYYGDYPGIDPYSNIIGGDTYGLRNGDVYRISITNVDEDQLMQDYNVALARLEREIEISGLDEFVMEPGDLNQDIIDFMKAEAQDRIVSYTAREYSSDVKTGTLRYEGYFLRSLEPEASGSYTNAVYIVYSSELSSAKKEFDPVTVYYPVIFSDILDQKGVQTYDGSAEVRIDGECQFADGKYVSRGRLSLPVYIAGEFEPDISYVTWCEDGLENYMDYQTVTSFSFVPENGRKEILEEARTAALRYIEANLDSWNVGFEIDRAYFLSSKDQTVELEERNGLLVVFKGEVSSRVGKDDSETVYYPVAFTGLLQMKDGSVEYARANGIQGDSALKNISVSTRGYTDIDKLVTELISSERDNYTVEELTDLNDGHKAEDFTSTDNAKEEVPLADLDYTSTPYVAVGTKDKEIYTDREGNVYEADNVILPVAGTAEKDWADPTGQNNDNEGYITFDLKGEYEKLEFTVYRPLCTERNIDTSKSESEDQWSVAPTLVVTGDGKTLYEMPLVTKRSTESFPVKVDVKGVNSLKIELTGVWIDTEDTEKEIYNRLPKICMGDAKVY